jgi:hypothetical protein
VSRGKAEEARIAWAKAVKRNEQEVVGVGLENKEYMMSVYTSVYLLQHKYPLETRQLMPKANTHHARVNHRTVQVEKQFSPQTKPEPRIDACW